MRTILDKMSFGKRPAPRRFVILGLPRSGTTYLMTLLRTHPQVFCTGELFNPKAVVEADGVRDESFEAVIEGRDYDPEGFVTRFFDRPHAPKVAVAGFKFMLGHNIRAFHALAADPDLILIHVWRENRLAQISSLMKAAQTNRWAQSKADAHVDAKIHSNPRQISKRWHEYEMTDFLFKSWLQQQPHQKISLEYKELFAPEFNRRICDFLEVAQDEKMKSGLVKQGSNTILDRFQDPVPIRSYFTRLGLAHWLEEEL